jgi:uncharacterized membrane protein
VTEGIQMAEIIISVALAIALGILAGLFFVWLRSRYGLTERTYSIHGVVGLAGMAVVFLIDRHRNYQFNVSGIYLIVLLLMPRFVKFKPSKPSE